MFRAPTAELRIMHLVLRKLYAMQYDADLPLPEEPLETASGSTRRLTVRRDTHEARLHGSMLSVRPCSHAKLRKAESCCSAVSSIFQQRRAWMAGDVALFDRLI